MKLTGYYMTAVVKDKDGIKTLHIVDVQNRKQLIDALDRRYAGEPYKLYDFERCKFGVEVTTGDLVDVASMLGLEDEV